MTGGAKGGIVIVGFAQKAVETVSLYPALAGCLVHPGFPAMDLVARGAGDIALLGSIPIFCKQGKATFPCNGRRRFDSNGMAVVSGGFFLGLSSFCVTGVAEAFYDLFTMFSVSDPKFGSFCIVRRMTSAANTRFLNGLPFGIP